MVYPEKKKRKSRKATAEDVPGTGQARKAGEAVEERKGRNRDYLRMAQQAVNPRKGESGGD